MSVCQTKKEIKNLEKALAPKRAELYMLAEGVRRDARVMVVWSADLEYRHRTYADLLKEVQEIETQLEELQKKPRGVKQTDIGTFLKK